MLFLYNISLRTTVKMSFGCSADCKFILTIKTWKEEEDDGAETVVSSLFYSKYYKTLFEWFVI